MKLLSHYMEDRMKTHPEIKNWQNHAVTEQLFYSHRDTMYDRTTYPANLHYHDYYELVVFEEGDITYVCETCHYHPTRGDVILIPPGKFHMSVLNGANTHYKRHVFYLYPSAFDGMGQGCLTLFLEQIKDEAVLASPTLEQRQELLQLLRRLHLALSDESSLQAQALALGYILQIFYGFNQQSFKAENSLVALPEKLLEVQQYIDRHFAQISSVSGIAEHFFYTREYISRLFKQHFGTTIWDYIEKRRIAESRLLIVQDIPLIDVAYQVGFGSLSTFIRAFRSVMSMTPSEYRKMWQDAKAHS